MVFVTFAQSILAMVETVILISMRTKFGRSAEGSERNTNVRPQHICCPIKAIQPRNPNDGDAANGVDESDTVFSEGAGQLGLNFELKLKFVDNITLGLNALITTAMLIKCATKIVNNESLFESKQQQ